MALPLTAGLDWAPVAAGLAPVVAVPDLAPVVAVADLAPVVARLDLPVRVEAPEWAAVTASAAAIPAGTKTKPVCWGPAGAGPQCTPIDRPALSRPALAKGQVR
jgi:hypothetical protein